MRFSRLAVLAACAVGTMACYLAIPTSGATFQDHEKGTITITVVIPSAPVTQQPAPDPSSATNEPVTPHGSTQASAKPDETKTTAPLPDPKATSTTGTPTTTTASPTPTETTVSPTATKKGGASDAPTP